VNAIDRTAATLAIRRPSGRTTDEDAADVEHLLQLEPGALRRIHPLHPEFTAPWIETAHWLQQSLLRRPEQPATPFIRCAAAPVALEEEVEAPRPRGHEEPAYLF
jgi:hypothetical protein